MISPARSAISALCIAAVLLAAVDTLRASADPLHPDALREYKIKAGFLYNFVIFVRWPPASFSDIRSPINLYIAGDAAIMPAFASLSGKKTKSRLLQLMHLEPGAPVPDDCHALFIATQEKTLIDQMLEQVRNRPVLTVGQTDGFLASGGIVNLFTKKNKIRFAVNVTAAKQADLKISSHMLKVARLKK